MNYLKRIFSWFSDLLSGDGKTTAIFVDTMNVRFHRGALQDSLETSVKVVSTIEALVEYLQTYLRADGLYDEEFIEREIRVENIRVVFYAHDYRIPADVYFVSTPTMPMLAIVDQEPEGLDERYKSMNHFHRGVFGSNIPAMNEVDYHPFPSENTHGEAAAKTSPYTG